MTVHQVYGASVITAVTAQMVKNAAALVLNLGTISSAQLNSMLKAERMANQLGIPVILDPVGVGATEFRTEAAHKILSELKISLIKGNKGEITFLAGKVAELKGVESIGEYKEIEKSAIWLARKLEAEVEETPAKFKREFMDTIYKFGL